MKTMRAILSGMLLLFVGVSLAVAVGDVTGLRPKKEPAPQTAEPAKSGEQWLMYYFHTSTRCPTCRAIETQAHEAVTPELEQGRVAWRVVNYEDSANRHFADEFKLLCPSVVLVQLRDGQAVRWKNLERVWELNDEPKEGVAYVQAELRAFLEGQP
jgi:hypothetical protein